MEDAGINPVRFQVTQSAFLVRLLGLLATLALSVGHELTLAMVTGIVIAALTSLFGLMNPSELLTVQRYPAVALLDLFIITVAVAVTGLDSPLVLVLLPTAILLGLWIERWRGFAVAGVLVCAYIWSITHQSFGQRSFLDFVILPFIFIAMWFLGDIIKVSTDSQQRAQEAVQDAMARNAAFGERTAMAREIHDSVAKSIQGSALMMSTLPALIERDPQAAQSRAREAQRMATQAVHELRVVMTSLRQRSSSESLSSAALSVVTDWSTSTGRHPELGIAPDLDTDDETVRFELLACLKEALDNVQRHAGPCDVWVWFEGDGDWLRAGIRDSGVGCSAMELEDSAAAGHHGITGIRERMARIGGIGEVISEPGRGTEVRLSVHREGLVERNRS